MLCNGNKADKWKEKDSSKYFKCPVSIWAALVLSYLSSFCTPYLILLAWRLAWGSAVFKLIVDSSTWLNSINGRRQTVKSSQQRQKRRTLHHFVFSLKTGS